LGEVDRRDKLLRLGLRLTTRGKLDIVAADTDRDMDEPPTTTLLLLLLLLSLVPPATPPSP
jgi:hypothetical protein